MSKKPQTAAPPPPLPPPYEWEWEEMAARLRAAKISSSRIFRALWQFVAQQADVPEDAILLIQELRGGQQTFRALKAGDPPPPDFKPPAPPPPPQTLGFSPITWVETPPADTTPAPSPPPPQTPGSSPVTRLETPLADAPPAPPHPIPARTKKRKGKTPAPNQPYEIKRQLSGEEAKKIASTGVPPMQTSPPPSPMPAPPSPPPPKPSTTRKGKGKLPSQEEAFKRHMATTKKGPSPRPGNTATSPPTTPDATTKGKTGIVIHGIALRKDLGKVRQWLEAANKELGKISGIRWLRKRTTLVEEGKKTSSAVVYLEKETDVERVRLGGRWLRSVRYESERGRK